MASSNAGSNVGAALDGIGGLYRAIIDAQRYTTASLTRYTKETNIIGRVYIERSLANEEIMTDLLGCLNQMYCGLVLTALNMDSFVVGSKKVRDMVQLVSTERWVDADQKVIDQFGVDRNALMIDKLNHNEIKVGEPVYYPGELTLEAAPTSGKNNNPPSNNNSGKNNNPPSNNNSGNNSSNASSSNDEADKNKDYDNKTPHGVGKVELEQATQRLISGRVLQVTFSGDEGKKVTALLYVQLVPQLIHTDTVNGYLQLNFSSSFWRRAKLLRAGEIRFFRDFILSFDQIENYRKALKGDKDGWLDRMLTKRQNNLFKYFRGVVGLDPENHNSANSIIITDQVTFAQACNHAGINFDNRSDRQHFFRKSFTMMVVVIDTMYQMVKMYFNGIDVCAEYTFKEIKGANKSSDQQFSLKDVMTMFGQNNVPRF